MYIFAAHANELLPLNKLNEALVISSFLFHLSSLKTHCDRIILFIEPLRAERFVSHVSGGLSG